MIKKGGYKKLPFIILFLLHFGLILITFYKKKDRKSLLILLLTYIGFSYVFDYIVLILYKGYQYKPNFFKIKKLDNVFGAVLSQAIFVPFTGVFITAFNLGWKTKVLSAVYFAIIERLFIFFGVFQNNWWRTIYTLVLIPLSFQVSDAWYKQIKKGKPVVLFISLVNTIQLIWMQTIYLFTLTKKIKFGLGKNHTWNEHFFVAPLYIFTISFYIAWSLWSKRLSKTMIFLTLVVADMWMMRMKFLKIKRHSNVILPLIHYTLLWVAEGYQRWIVENRSM